MGWGPRTEPERTFTTRVRSEGNVWSEEIWVPLAEFVEKAEQAKALHAELELTRSASREQGDMVPRQAALADLDRRDRIIDSLRKEAKQYVGEIQSLQAQLRDVRAGHTQETNLRLTVGALERRIAELESAGRSLVRERDVLVHEKEDLVRAVATEHAQATLLANALAVRDDEAEVRRLKRQIAAVRSALDTEFG